MSSHKGRTSCDYAPHCRTAILTGAVRIAACPPDQHRPGAIQQQQQENLERQQREGASAAGATCAADQHPRPGDGPGPRARRTSASSASRSIARRSSQQKRSIPLLAPVAGHRGQPAGSVRPGRLDQPPLRRPSSTHRPGDPAAADGHRRHGAHPPGGGASRRAAGGAPPVARRLHSPPPQPRAGPADVGTATSNPT